MEEVEIADLRNLRHVRMGLGPGLNVFAGRNAQGKTSLLEAVAILARGRSFRTDDARTLIRAGAAALRARGLARHEGHVTGLEVELSGQGRRLRVDGREVAPRAYQGRLEVVVYSTDRLKVIHGPMRERRQFLDRGASALWPAYRQAVREYERVVQQRNASTRRSSRAPARSGGPATRWSAPIAIRSSSRWTARTPPVTPPPDSAGACSWP